MAVKGRTIKPALFYPAEARGLKWPLGEAIVSSPSAMVKHSGEVVESSGEEDMVKSTQHPSSASSSFQVLKAVKKNTLNHS